MSLDIFRGFNKEHKCSDYKNDTTSRTLFPAHIQILCDSITMNDMKIYKPMLTYLFNLFRIIALQSTYLFSQPLFVIIQNPTSRTHIHILAKTSHLKHDSSFFSKSSENKISVGGN